MSLVPFHDYLYSFVSFATMPDESTISNYELLDFGQGSKWERFGNVVVKRPCPAAENVSPTQKRAAEIRFDRVLLETPKWVGTAPDRWREQFGDLIFQLKLSPHGQVGVFPEQQTNWRFIESAVQQSKVSKVLNLFAYTGGSTLAAAKGGAAVTHIDAAKSVVAWARTNADASGLGDRPIRWIAEDATRFVRREIRRGATYEGLILDPPSFGRGPKGEVWKLENDLAELLRLCRRLAPKSGFRMVVLSCHTIGFGHHKLVELMEKELQIDRNAIEAFPLTLVDSAERKLNSGWTARYRFNGSDL